MHGLFAAEFKRDRGKVLRCVAHDLLSDGFAPGKKDVVEAGIEKTGVLCTSACYNCNVLRRKKSRRLFYR